ncbi:hypothetical protein POSPLADRAFT_1051273 [Postia placenta MAD-698-R-SB12]|uniref:carboxypeptidase C n=1 Tax=Postia placenta MAD-698-R-SB12 TaxID=670580 RepID=A0A1X6NER1_9APHY|nr:hypothetical protein POSPLADRAFT_1051273 [Postia placenta MAD-698-R-SB12]OSX67119.1 hypothetical protein POSPLADRAFT_1051273 [Postia placenta MAD-698-R-SB12]
MLRKAVGLLLAASFVTAFRLEPGVQHAFSTHVGSSGHTGGATPDVVGQPNLATRLEMTSDPNATLFCARKGDKSTAGYAHFTNANGEEDKHMFWWWFHARKDPENAPVVLIFGGGPGSSGMFMPFSGAGPCRVTAGEDGAGAAVPAEYSWTDEVNVLAIGHPVGVGHSYGTSSSLRNSSERAAWDVDDFLQAFWVKYPSLTKGLFMIQSASYGGTYIPNIVNVIHSRNLAAAEISTSARVVKSPDAASPVPSLHDAEMSIERFSLQTCDVAVGAIYAAGLTGRNPYHATQACNIGEVYDCFPEMGRLNDVMHSDKIRSYIKVPDEVHFVYTSEDTFHRFYTNGDMAQPAYQLLTPAINAGLRVLVYNGNTDGVCSWRSNVSWMRLLKTTHQAAFRTAPDIAWPGVGWLRQMMPVTSSSEDAFREILVKWLRNETFVDTDADSL